jgi:integrase
VITTGAVRHVTDWGSLVTGLGHSGLRRHDLRHTGATWFANSGVPLHIISDILGHASIETTRAYLHTDDDALIEAAGTLDRYLRRPPNRPRND